MTNDPTTQVETRSTPATTTTHPPSISAPVSTTRGSPRMRHQRAASQGARLRGELACNQPSHGAITRGNH